MSPLGAAVGTATGMVALGASLPRRPARIRPLPAAVDRRSARPDGRLRPAHLAMALGSMTALLVAPPLALIPPLCGWAHGRLLRLRRARAHARAVADGLPDAVDLLLLCTSAGWSLPMAHPEVGARVPPPVGTVLTGAARAADGGRARADALVDALAPLGERAHALGQVLADHLRYGGPLAPGLERLSLELRLDRRRRAEVEARRVPVRLLGPLVCCVLPAFALLTVVPLLAASLQALPS